MQAHIEHDLEAVLALYLLLTALGLFVSAAVTLRHVQEHLHLLVNHGLLSRAECHYYGCIVATNDHLFLL